MTRVKGLALCHLSCVRTPLCQLWFPPAQNQRLLGPGCLSRLHQTPALTRCLLGDSGRKSGALVLYMHAMPWSMCIRRADGRMCGTCLSHAEHVSLKCTERSGKCIFFAYALIGHSRCFNMVTEEISYQEYTSLYKSAGLMMLQSCHPAGLSTS